MGQSLQPLLKSLKLPSSSHSGTAHTSSWSVPILPKVSTTGPDSDLQLYISNPLETQKLTVSLVSQTDPSITHQEI